MMDKIVIKDLVLMANHGLYQEEKNLGQRFSLDIEISLDTQKAGLYENLDDSINYGELAQEVGQIFTKESIDLIESLGELVASYILKTYDLAKEVRLRIKKPWAPVGMVLDTLYVEITRKKSRAFIGIGTNMGDLEKNLSQAIDKIEDDYTKITNKSSFYKTKAWGLENQDDFLNGVLEVETLYTPQNLLSHLQKIENNLGRERKENWGPRIIDLDILFIDDMVIREKNLTVPHPYFSERQFVLEPLNEIASKFVDPISHKTIEQIFRDFNTQN